MNVASQSMSRSYLVTLALLSLVCGCRSEQARDTQPPTETRARKASELDGLDAKPRTRTYDAQGRLIPSDDYVVGIRLPRGAELFREDERQHVYRIRAPIDKVLAYFGPMMITGSVERQGKGAVYKRASVRGAEVNPTKVDLSILEVGNGMTRISVTELPPPPRYIPSSDQTKAAAKESFRMLD